MLLVSNASLFRPWNQMVFQLALKANSLLREYLLNIEQKHYVTNTFRKIVVKNNQSQIIGVLQNQRNNKVIGKNLVSPNIFGNR